MKACCKGLALFRRAAQAELANSWTRWRISATGVSGDIGAPNATVTG